MASPFTLTGSRIQNATRVNQAAEDADVTDWVVGDDFIICMMVEAGGAGASGTIEIEWRNVTDAGAFTKLIGTGELNWNGVTDLVNDNAVTAGEEACTPISGTTHGDGVEREGANDVSPTLPANYYAEGQYAVDGSGMLSGKQYEFRVWDATDGSSIGTCLAQITTAAAGSTGTGAVQASTSTASGAGESINTFSGVMQALTATLSGAGESIYEGSAALVAQTATTVGSGIEGIIGSGTLQASTATATGYDVAPEEEKGIFRSILRSPIKSIFRNILA